MLRDEQEEKKKHLFFKNLREINCIKKIYLLFLNLIAG